MTNILGSGEVLFQSFHWEVAVRAVSLAWWQPQFNSLNSLPRSDFCFCLNHKSLLFQCCRRGLFPYTAKTLFLFSIIWIQLNNHIN